MQNNGGNVRPDSDLSGGAVSALASKDAKGLWLLLRTHSENCVVVEAMSLAVKFSRDVPCLLELCIGDASEDTAEVLAATM